MLLSGSGGSYLENVLWKQQPLEVKPLAEPLLGYTTIHRSLTENDVIVSLIHFLPEDTKVVGAVRLGFYDLKRFPAS